MAPYVAIHRVRALCRHLQAEPLAGEPFVAGVDPKSEQVMFPGHPGASKAKDRVPPPKLSLEKQQELFKILAEYKMGMDKLKEDGTPPSLTAFDVQLATENEVHVASRKQLNMEIDKAEQIGTDIMVLKLLPGPWQDAKNRDAQLTLLRESQLAAAQGYDIHLIAKWQQQYGGRGLSGNIAVPSLVNRGWGPETKTGLVGRVIVADPADAARIARTHVRKEGNFEPILLDGVIATTDNESWRQQRAHLAEAFLPLSSLAEILPVSLARAKSCAQRLAGLAAGGREVDMSDFLLHEAQAQLQLALLGVPETFMEETNEGIRAAFTGDPAIGKVGHLGKSLQTLLQMAGDSKTFSLPTDGCPVRGPLSRAVQCSEATKTADYGNMLLILFAGHDTTGHTMTWLLFELGRNPEVQRKLQAEVDRFFADLGGQDPTYKDLSRLDFMDQCITETLRMWPAVANGTFRQLQFDDVITGPDGGEVALPRGTLVNIQNWARHRNPELWGEDVNLFNPSRKFQPAEVARVGCPMAAANPASERFSPFAHSPRSCLGRNFAQMEMRLIMLYLLRDFSFSLTPTYQKLVNRVLGPTADPAEFRGINRATMGPMDLENSTQQSWGTRPLYAMKMIPCPRSTQVSS